MLFRGIELTIQSVELGSLGNCEMVEFPRATKGGRPRYLCRGGESNALVRWTVPGSSCRKERGDVVKLG